jgi:hypothetical protein
LVLKQHQDNSRNQRTQLKQLLRSFIGAQDSGDSGHCDVSIDNIPDFIDDPVKSLPEGYVKPRVYARALS